MRKNYRYTVCIVFCLIFMTVLSGCDSMSSSNNSDGVAMGDYYKIEDFQAIVIGESTLHNVYEIAPVESMQVTSYGGFCEYPMQDGGCIRIEFYGEDLIVGAIEEISR